MRRFRRALILIATMAVTAMLAAAPAFAQTTTPTTQPAPVQQEKQQGLGIFLQGGYLRSSTYSSGGTPDLNFNPQGVIFGIGFGGNKSGAFGVGVDINYVMKSASDVELDTGDIFETGSFKTQSLNIPVYGRFNIGGHNTKNAPTFYIPVGWFFDILLSSKLDDLDVKDKFNGFQTGPLVGAGFEVARIGVEARFQWAIKEIESTGGGTFLNGVTDSKVFTWVVLFKVRLN